MDTLAHTQSPPAPDADLDAVRDLAEARRLLTGEIEKRIVGQREVVDALLVALFARGHCLFVGVPGLAKTLLISTVAEALELSFSRIQFTPDLMPSDITGTDVLEEDHTTGRRTFRFVKGPIFANLLLADDEDGQSYNITADAAAAKIAIALKAQKLIYLTDVACKLFDSGACQCSDYPNRQKRVHDCVKLTPKNVPTLNWLPKTCAYRLVSEGRDLFWWHPLVSGSRETVHQANVSVRGKTRLEGRLKPTRSSSRPERHCHDSFIPIRCRSRASSRDGCLAAPRATTAGGEGAMRLSGGPDAVASA